MQPGGHRFEPGILHQPFANRSLRWPLRWRAKRDDGATGEWFRESVERGDAQEPLAQVSRRQKTPAGRRRRGADVDLSQLNILQTVVFPIHKTHAVFLVRVGRGTVEHARTMQKVECLCQFLHSNGQATKGVR